MSADERRAAFEQRQKEREARARAQAIAAKDRQEEYGKGQRWLRSGSTAEVFSRQMGKWERESPAGEVTKVSHLLSPHLDLTPLQRATGNCYGAYVEAVTGGGVSAFAREFVDQSHVGSGGASEALVTKMRMVSVARSALQVAAKITYPLGKPRGDGAVGKHSPISPLVLADAICVNGLPLESVAKGYGWTVERKQGAKVGHVVPDRQRKHIAHSLRLTLDLVYNAWENKHLDIPHEFLTVTFK